MQKLIKIKHPPTNCYKEKEKEKKSNLETKYFVKILSHKIGRA